MTENKGIEGILNTIASELPEGERERNVYFTQHYSRYLFTLEALSRVVGNQIHDGFKVLDVGCYPGHLSMALTKMGYDVFGISVEVEHYRRVLKTPNIRSIQECNVEYDPFPFEDSFFDLVLFTEIIEHLPYSPLPALREIHRVLKKGGHMVITTPNDQWIVRRILRLKNALLFRSGFTNLTDLKRRLELRSPYFTHHIKYTMREIKAILDWTDFDIIKEDYFPCSSGFGRLKKRFLPAKILISLITKILPQFRLFLLVIAKKP